MVELSEIILKTTMERSIELNKLIESNNNTVYTHAGSIHADDVYAVASAACLTDCPMLVKVERLTNDQITERGLDDTNAFIVDIGGGRFDHHFNPKDEEESKMIRYYPEELDGDGNPKPRVMMSAVARLWDYAGEEIVVNTMYRLLKEQPVAEYCCEVANNVIRSLIMPISDTDTLGQGQRPNFISAGISKRSFLCQNRNEIIKMDDEFRIMVDEAIQVIEAYIFDSYMYLKNIDEIESIANTAAMNNHSSWVKLDRFIKAGDFKNITNVKFVVVKNNRDGRFNVNCVDNTKWPIDNRVSELEGHYDHGTFWSSFDTEETAVKAAIFLSNLY